MVVKGCCLLLYGFLLFVLLTNYSYAETDTLVRGDQLGVAGHLVSAFGTFTLGFLENYLAVWYTKRPEPENELDRMRWDREWRYGRNKYGKRVWVANPNDPVHNGQLSIGSDGNLKIFQRGGDVVSITSAQVSSGCNTSATLQEDGNFVLHELNKDGSVRRLLWQSFDYPTNTFLPGMKIGMNIQTGHRWVATSGSFSFGMDPNETRQLVVWWEGQVYWDSGVQTDGHFNMSDEIQLNYFSNDYERYFTYNGLSSFPALILDDGTLRTSDEPLVSCYEDSYTNRTVGCMPTCRTSNPRPQYFYYPISTLSGYKINERACMNEECCRMLCSMNCSCFSYAFSDFGCRIWSAEAYREAFGDSTSKKAPLGLFIGLGVGGAVLICISCFGLWIYKHPDVVLRFIRAHLMALVTVMKRALKECRERGSHILLSMMVTNTEQEILLSEIGIDEMHNPGHGGKRNQELQFFSLEIVKTATENFLSRNKLGEGGFGSVYKGKLPGGQEVAIKRLSTNSRQGMVEFKNEIKVIAKLQHNNLVRLVGCCLEKGEKILIYEYMPNKSLDFFLFDEANRSELNWGRRFKIIDGIAQGLLYLHKYSRLKIIHRDLKAGNILLDSEMNPKISDFGMAKIFGAEESKANTNRVVGTYGYMPPEYAIDGIFSTKSDVYSFGVLLLEIVSGRRNNSFRHSDGPLSLILYAWELWTQDRVVELIDRTIEERHHKEVIRCVHVGLLCVQENPMDRPNMLDVASTLYNEAAELRSPNQPAFYNRTNLRGLNLAGYSPENLSQNEVTITEVEGR